MVPSVVRCSLSVVSEFRGIHERENYRKTMNEKEGYIHG
jgi:hypothetical protein